MTNGRCTHIDQNSTSTDRWVKVCDWRRGPGRRTGAGFNTTGSDDCLHRELRTEAPLTPITGDLTVPTNIVTSVWVLHCMNMGRVSSFLKGETIVTRLSAAHPLLHSGRAPRFYLQRWIVSHTLRCSHDDSSRSRCWKGQGIFSIAFSVVGAKHVPIQASDLIKQFQRPDFTIWDSIWLNIYVVLIKCHKQINLPWVIFPGAQAGALLLAHHKASPISAHRLFL